MILTVVKQNTITMDIMSGSSSVGRASAFQAECREFESRLPLQIGFANSIIVLINKELLFQK